MHSLVNVLRAADECEAGMVTVDFVDLGDRTGYATAKFKYEGHAARFAGRFDSAFVRTVVHGFDVDIYNVIVG